MLDRRVVYLGCQAGCELKPASRQSILHILTKPERLAPPHAQALRSTSLALEISNRSDRALQTGSQDMAMTHQGQFRWPTVPHDFRNAGLPAAPICVGYGISRLPTPRWAPSPYSIQFRLGCPRWFGHHLCAPSNGDFSARMIPTVIEANICSRQSGIALWHLSQRCSCFALYGCAPLVAATAITPTSAAEPMESEKTTSTGH